LRIIGSVGEISSEKRLGLELPRLGGNFVRIFGWGVNKITPQHAEERIFRR